jgi:hypothetical protein
MGYISFGKDSMGCRGFGTDSLRYIGLHRTAWGIGATQLTVVHVASFRRGYGVVAGGTNSARKARAGVPV